jgi:hypothetical protein
MLYKNKTSWEENSYIRTPKHLFAQYSVLHNSGLNSLIGLPKLYSQASCLSVPLQLILHLQLKFLKSAHLENKKCLTIFHLKP